MVRSKWSAYFSLKFFPSLSMQTVPLQTTEDFQREDALPSLKQSEVIRIHLALHASCLSFTSISFTCLQRASNSGKKFKCTFAKWLHTCNSKARHHEGGKRSQGTSAQSLQSTRNVYFLSLYKSSLGFVLNLERNNQRQINCLNPQNSSNYII